MVLHQRGAVSSVYRRSSSSVQLVLVSIPLLGFGGRCSGVCVPVDVLSLLTHRVETSFLQVLYTLLYGRDRRAKG